MNWQKAYQAADFVFYCLLINVTVIIGALVGGIIFGLAPSVQAGFHVAKKTLKQEDAQWCLHQVDDTVDDCSFSYLQDWS